MMLPLAVTLGGALPCHPPLSKRYCTARERSCFTFTPSADRTRTIMLIIEQPSRLPGLEDVFGVGDITPTLFPK
jgi:hypothetical protein